MSNAAPSIPTTVLTGFLGSGKTTLLNALLSHAELRDTAVLVNEFGEVGIDHLLVESLEDEDIVLLNAGCLCCTIRDDLVGTLCDLWEKREDGSIPEFRRVVIETTGLADPAPILHTLLSHEAVKDQYTVNGIVTTVDAVNAERQLDEHVECLKQVAVADRIVVTKSDLADPLALEQLSSRLAAINAGAPVLTVVQGEVDPSQLLNVGLYDLESKDPKVEEWLRQARDEDHHHPPNVNRHDDRISTFYLETSEALPIHRFIAWIENLLETHGENLLRLKGILDIEGSDTPIVVHGVQHIFHPLTSLPAWPGGEPRSRLVLIVRDLDHQAIEQSFNQQVLGRP